MSLHKKYLVKKSKTIDSFKKNAYRNCIEFYTKISNCKIVKYINENEQYFKIIRFGRDKEKYVKKEIDKKTFLKKRKLRISNIIEKSFYYISHNVYFIEYKDFDIKFLYFISKKNERYLSLLKEKYIDYIEQDVTKNVKYSDFYLSMLGATVDSDFNIYKIFKEIEKGKDMKDLLKENIDYRDAVRIKLYMLYINLVQDRFDILERKNNIESINNFKKNIENIIILLEEYHEIFDSGVHEKVLENLTLVHKYTSVYNTIQALKNNMSELKSCDDKDFYSLIQKYDSDITEKVNIFLMFLETKEYSIIIKQLEILIKELSQNVEINENITIENSIKKKIKKNFKKSLKTIEKNIYCEDEESVIKIINRLNRVLILIKSFKSLFVMSKYYESKGKIENLLNTLNQYRYTFIFKSIVLDDIDEQKSKDCIMNKIEEKQDILLKDIKRQSKKYKKAFLKK